MNCPTMQQRPEIPQILVAPTPIHAQCIGAHVLVANCVLGLQMASKFDSFHANAHKLTKTCPNLVKEGSNESPHSSLCNPMLIFPIIRCSHNAT